MSPFPDASQILSDTLRDPSQALSDLYQKNKQEGIDGFPSTVTAHFSAIFKPQDAFQRIPVLDLHQPPEYFSGGSMVVFDAMVQDTSLAPELYLAISTNGSCGGWGIPEDIDSDDDNIQQTNLRECSIFWAVSIPGLSPWCRGVAEPATIQSAQPHKYPIPNANHIGVQLKVYDEHLARPIRTTDIMTLVGILSLEPLHASIDLQNPVNVPTLHVLFALPIPSTVIPRTFPDAHIVPNIKAIREDLIQWIADEGLAGDCIAAEWVFLCGLARVRSRHPPVLPLSLTIARFPSSGNGLSLTPALYHVVSQIFPLVSILPLALETLNNGTFFPESINEDLHSGILQQPKGTMLFLTEGAVTEGAIFNKGIANIRSTQKMMEDQILEYSFPYSNFQFETDINFLVTTEGKQSTFFKTDINIPLRPSVSSDLTKGLYKPVDAISLPPPEKLHQFRRLVGGSKIGSASVAEDLGKRIEDDFICERSSGNNGMNGSGDSFSADDLIQRMLVARLLALSLHQTEVTVDNWERAKVIERQTKLP